MIDPRTTSRDADAPEPILPVEEPAPEFATPEDEAKAKPEIADALYQDYVDFHTEAGTPTKDVMTYSQWRKHCKLDP